MNKLDANILLAEDELSLQYVFEKQLKMLGYKAPEMAENGLIAVKRAKQKRFDLIFMDVRMPELDGVSAVKRIRQDEERAGVHTPVVGLTAFAHRLRCLDAGMDDFLQKPVMLFQLEEVLNKWLQAVPSETVLLDIEPRSDLNKFKSTNEKLKEIQQRIEDLRRRSGLD